MASRSGRRHLHAAGLAAGILLASGGAHAQLNPQELLKQVLPGSDQSSGSDGDESTGERACERYAEKQGFDVRKVRDSQRSGRNNLEITLSVEDGNDRYDARCIYDTGDRKVRDFARVQDTGRGDDRKSVV